MTRAGSVLRQMWVVRVVVDETTATWFDNPVLECLRYAEVIRVHSPTPAGHRVFDLFPPLGTGVPASKTWAENNAERMQTFRLNAVAAPATH